MIFRRIQSQILSAFFQTATMQQIVNMSYILLDLLPVFETLLSQM